MSVTIKDIARHAKVSYSTVSRALSDHPGVKDDTRTRIKKLAEEMRYTPNALAKGLVTKSTCTLGLVVPDIANPFYPEVAQGIEECANQNGYQVFLCNTSWNIEKEREYLVKLSSSRVDGIIIGPASDDISHIAELSPKIPVVFVAYRPMAGDCSYVVTDDYKSAVLAVEYLVKLGHRKIAYIGGRANSSTEIDRFKGFRAGLGEYGLKLEPKHVLRGEYKQASGFQLACEMLLQRDLPTAVLAGNDLIALGVMQAIEEYGLKVPKDISVIGFDDISFASLDKIQLTTIFQPKYEMGRISVEMLLQKIKKTEMIQERARILEPRLVVRKTCTGI